MRNYSRSHCKVRRQEITYWQTDISRLWFPQIKAARLLEGDVMFASILNDVQKNGAIHATSVSNAMWDCALPTILKISMPYRRCNVISYKPVQMDKKINSYNDFLICFFLSPMSAAKELMI
jgi:hypothetical protein